MSSRRSRVGGGSTYRSEAIPSARPTLQPPSAFRGPPKTGRRATSRSDVSVPPSTAASAMPPPMLSSSRSTARSTASRYDGGGLFSGQATPAGGSARAPMTGVSRTSRSRQPRLSQTELEAAVNREVADIFTKVDKDVAFNKADEQESFEANKILKNELPDERGVIPIMDRIRDEDKNRDGTISEDERFVNQRSELAMSAPATPDPVLDGSWRKNYNPYLKWWQGTSVQEMTGTEAQVRGLVGLGPSHPAYFCVRRKAPTLEYVDAPTYKTRAELLEARKKCAIPDKSYDLDGDGVVGVREYFMAARLDKDASGSLTLDEKRQGLANMRADLAGLMFVDNAGKANDRHEHNQYRILQQDGQIVLDP